MRVFCFGLLTACGKESGADEPQPISDAPVAVTWDSPPHAGKANLRLALVHEGKPFKGQSGLVTQFELRALAGGSLFTQGFNPDADGRVIIEGLEPGDYQLTVSARQAEFKSWQKSARVEGIATFEVELTK